ncbi:MAG: site-specific integrase [Actinobacteria bacterium]|nr:site-specific integrase [Actinomycetota bacterium]
MASICKRYKKDGTTRYVVRFNDPFGNRTEKVAGSTKKAAELLKTRIERELAEGTYRATVIEDYKFSEFCERFLKAKKGRVKDLTLTFYKMTINNYLKPYLGDMRLSEITPSKVNSLIEYLSDNGKSITTQGKAMRTLRVILRWAVTLELIPRDPTAAIRVPKTRRKELTIITPEQYKKLLSACAEDLYDLVAIAGLAGLRQGEIVALRWKDIDFEYGVIRVMRNYFPGHGFSDLKTASSRRAVPIVATLDEILRLRYQEQKKLPPDALVFPNSKGKPLDRARFFPRFKEALKKAELPDMSFHDLRHFYASLGIASGMDPKALQVAMGHSSIQVTMDVYGHLFPGSYDKALAKMEEIMSVGEKLKYLQSKGKA